MPIYSAISLIMLCIALFCLFSPFIAPFSTALSKNMQTGYMILGGVGTMFFAFVTSYTVFNIISPPVGITISENGIYEYTVANCGAGFIPKEAIVSLKTFGKDKRKYLGINIDASYVSGLGEGIAAKKEITNNVSAGIPAVIIRQSDVYVSVTKLLNLIMDAYAKTTDAPPSTKVEEPTPRTIVEEPTVTKNNDAVDTIIKQAVTESSSDNDLSINTAINKPTAKKETSETETINVSELPPPPNVIKTVDELLEKLNIPTKSHKPDSNGETDKK